MHQGPEGWTVFEFGNKMHTADDLPSLAITGKHDPLVVLQGPSTAMGSTEAWNPEVEEAQPDQVMEDQDDDLMAEHLKELSQMWYPTPPAKDEAVEMIDLVTKIKEEKKSPVQVVQQPLSAAHPMQFSNHFLW